MVSAKISSIVTSAIVIVSLAVVVLGGCAMSQEGAVDFRKASLSKQAIRQKEIKETPLKEDYTPVIAARLVSKFVAAPHDTNAAIQRGRRWYAPSQQERGDSFRVKGRTIT